MTIEKDEEGFLSRWSRKKREAEEAERAPRKEAEAPPHVETAEPAPESSPEIPTVDLTKLPSIESITANTDIRGFLAPGVPVELTRAALRRAWVADPKIRDFIGIAENQWDFTAPDSIPGFGGISGEDVRRLVSEVLGETKPETKEEETRTKGEEVAPVSAEKLPNASPPPQLADATTTTETQTLSHNGDAASQHKNSVK